MSRAYIQNHQAIKKAFKLSLNAFSFSRLVKPTTCQQANGIDGTGIYNKWNYVLKDFALQQRSYKGITFSACGPFCPVVIVNSTFCPSTNDLKPSA